MLANYHTHTYLCHHAYDEPRQYVEQAIKNGLEILISPDTKKRNFEFAVAWIANINGKNKEQTWLAADPHLLKNFL